MLQADKTVPHNIHEGHRQRQIDKFLKDGFGEGKPQHEILEILLYFAIPRKDTNPIAGELIRRFGSIAGVFNASPQELMKVDGVGKNTAAFLNMIPEIFRVYRNDRLSHVQSFSSVDDIGLYLLERYKCETREFFSVISLGNGAKMIAFDEVSVGDTAVVGVSMRKLAEIILRTNPTAVVLAHNHPHGNALPSPSDLASTKETAEFLKNIGVHLLDHIIVCDDDYISLAQSRDYKGLFNK